MYYVTTHISLSFRFFFYHLPPLFAWSADTFDTSPLFFQMLAEETPPPRGRIRFLKLHKLFHSLLEASPSQIAAPRYSPAFLRPGSLASATRCLFFFHITSFHPQTFFPCISLHSLTESADSRFYVFPAVAPGTSLQFSNLASFIRQGALQIEAAFTWFFPHRLPTDVRFS